MTYQRIMGVLLVVACMGTVLPVEAKDKSSVLKASQLLGMKVEGTDGKKLGSIKDMVVDPVDGSIDYLVLDFGGLAGIGDKYFAVPWGAFQFAPDGKKLAIAATKKDLKDAPGFDKSNWPDLSDQAQITTIYEFYEVPVPPPSSSKPDSKAERMQR